MSGGSLRNGRNARINLTIDAEEVDRLELSLVFEALLQRVQTGYPTWTGFGLALQYIYQTRSLELIEHVGALAGSTAYG